MPWKKLADAETDNGWSSQIEYWVAGNPRLTFLMTGDIDGGNFKFRVGPTDELYAQFNILDAGLSRLIFNATIPQVSGLVHVYIDPVYLDEIEMALFNSTTPNFNLWILSSRSL